MNSDEIKKFEEIEKLYTAPETICPECGEEYYFWDKDGNLLQGATLERCEDHTIIDLVYESGVFHPTLRIN